MTEAVRVALYGMGSIGAEIAKECLSRNLDIVAAVDIAEDKVGKDVGEVAGLDRQIGIPVSRDIRSALKKGGGDVVFHCTTSYIWEAHPQLAEAVQTGCDVISTCEELSYPWRAHRHFAQEIDQAAKREGVTVLGTGVNPGFVMDALVIALSSMCNRVRQVYVERIVDVAKRRLPLQRKVGVGLSEREFLNMVKEGKLGHVGTYESIDMIAEAFGWDMTDVQVDITPVVSEKAIRGPHLEVETGKVAGIRQVGKGLRSQKEVISFELQMYVGASPGDLIRIDGIPAIEVNIPGGVAGDQATVAAVINSVPRVMNAEAGLKTMLDLPLPGYAESLWSDI